MEYWAEHRGEQEGCPGESGMRGEDGTYDLSSPGRRLRAMDLAMRQYFGSADWRAARDGGLPGIDWGVEPPLGSDE